MRSCKKCLAAKAEDDFYAGYSACKECVKARVRAYRANNLERVKAYDRQRGLLPERMAKNREGYRRRISTPEGRIAEWNKQRAWAESSPERRAAHVIVGNAVRDGKLERRPCERCGEIKAHAHHEDYSKPLDVIWLCRPCHGRRHREINAERRAQG